jgi:predicted MFS family arabinose efflux permease
MKFAQLAAARGVAPSTMKTVKREVLLGAAVVSLIGVTLGLALGQRFGFAGMMLGTFGIAIVGILLIARRVERRLQRSESDRRATNGTA